MSEPIKVGDLVIVVRSCCGDGVGRIFHVVDVDCAPLFHSCGLYTNERPCASGAPLRANSWFDLAWLKRIPPLGELEGVDEKETLHA